MEVVEKKKKKTQPSAVNGSSGSSVKMPQKAHCMALLTG